MCDNVDTYDAAGAMAIRSCAHIPCEGTYRRRSRIARALRRVPAGVHISRLRGPFQNLAGLSQFTGPVRLFEKAHGTPHHLTILRKWNGSPNNITRVIYFWGDLFPLRVDYFYAMPPSTT